MPFVYIGSSSAAQTAASGSPVYGKVEAPSTQRKGILVLQRTPAGSLEPVKFVELDVHVGWVAAHPTNGCVYACGGGAVFALRARADGSLTPVGLRSDACGNPAHLDVSADGGWVLTANYSAGVVASFPIKADGSVGPAADSKIHVPLTSSVFKVLHPELADRQECSHPHHVRLSPGGARWALLCDLGADCVWVYAFDAARGALVGAANSGQHLAFPKGSGPRHLDFHPSGKYVYVLCELSGEVATCTWDADQGVLTVVASVQSLPAGVTPSRAHHSGGAHILCAPDGKSVYASTRTDGAVVHFAVDASSGALTRGGSVSCGGVCPRHFHLDYAVAPPRLRVGNQDSQTVASFALGDDGALKEPPEMLELDGVCPNVLTPPYAVPPF